jgi:hypothetical protein
MNRLTNIVSQNFVPGLQGSFALPQNPPALLFSAPVWFALLLSILLLSERCPLPKQKALRSVAALVAEIERRARFLR